MTEYITLAILILALIIWFKGHHGKALIIGVIVAAFIFSQASFS